MWARRRYQGARAQSPPAARARPVVLVRLHPLEADGRCVVGVRRIDSDRARSRTIPSRTVSIARWNATTRPETFRTTSSSSVVWDMPPDQARARTAPRCARCASRTIGRHGLVHAPVRRASRQSHRRRTSMRFAGFGVQRPNLVGDPTLPADQRTPAHWFNTAAFAVAPHSRSGRHRGILFGARVSRCRSRPDAPPADRRPAGRSRCARRCSTCSTRQISARPPRSSARRTSGRLQARSTPRVVQLAFKWVLQQRMTS